MKQIILGIITILTVSCSSIRQMEVYIPKPVLVQLPSDIKRLVIVDKTQGNALTAIEGILTGEMIGIDKILSQECIAGITSPFLKNSTIEITRNPDRLNSENKTSTGFGTTMNWNQVEEIAKANNSDALLVLEYFDSDFRVRNVTSPNNVGTVLFQGYAKASVGIRIYLPKTRSLFYEKDFSYSKLYGETAASQAQLIAKLTLGTDALKFVSYQLGNRIGKRFVSYRIWEDRVIFKGKNSPTQRAERLIIAQDHGNAIPILETAFNNENDAKVKAGIAHNLGYCYEIKGDLQVSKKWLTESYAISGNIKTKNYLDIINRRIEEEYILETQKNK
jgi:hypothetical protein